MAKAYKLKTKKAMSKRFRVTGSGKVKANHQNKRHTLGPHRTRKSKLSLKSGFYLTPGDAAVVIRGLPYGSLQ